MIWRYMIFTDTEGVVPPPSPSEKKMMTRNEGLLDIQPLLGGRPPDNGPFCILPKQVVATKEEEATNEGNLIYLHGFV